MRERRAHLLLALVLLVLVAASMLLGPGMRVHELLTSPSDLSSAILFQLRLPRTLLAIAVGAALSLSGVLMQALFRNPLAEPYVTGVSAGAALTGVAVSALGLSLAAHSLAALCGSLLITLALFAIALRKSATPQTLVLCGMALGTLCGAGVWMLLLHQGPGGADQAIAWLLGRVSTVGYVEPVTMVLSLALSFAMSMKLAPLLDTYALGDEKAASLGLDILTMQRTTLAIAAFLAGISVALCGVIAFAGLIVPHVCRLYGTVLHRGLIPLAAHGGAVFLVAVDLACRLLDPPRELPITVITSLLGAPFFLLVLLSAREAY